MRPFQANSGCLSPIRKIASSKIRPCFVLHSVFEKKDSTQPVEILYHFTSFCATLLFPKKTGHPSRFWKNVLFPVRLSQTAFHCLRCDLSPIDVFPQTDDIMRSSNRQITPHCLKTMVCAVAVTMFFRMKIALLSFFISSDSKLCTLLYRSDKSIAQILTDVFFSS